MSKLLLILMLGASAFDVGTTEYALERGAREFNPLLQNRPVRITVNIAAPIAIWKATSSMNEGTRLKVCLSYVGFKTAVGVHNIMASKESEPQTTTENLEDFTHVGRRTETIH